ncbi:MAG: hypothetical protein IJ682_08120 [Lachnospiraceae bacterium]|nr:hypothetical protein [Lachnospiraceae bacterium]
MHTLNKKIYGLCFGIMIILLLSACGSQNDLMGHWVFEGESGEEGSHYAYDIVFREDGTGSADGVSMNWSIDGEQLVLVLGIYGDYTYSYSLSGNELILDEDRVYEKQ